MAPEGRSKPSEYLSCHFVDDHEGLSPEPVKCGQTPQTYLFVIRHFRAKGQLRKTDGEMKTGSFAVYRAASAGEIAPLSTSTHIHVSIRNPMDRKSPSKRFPARDYP
jgi:hypothetical protein